MKNILLNLFLILNIYNLFKDFINILYDIEYIIFFTNIAVKKSHNKIYVS